MKSNAKFDALFTPVRVANVEIRNRIAMAPMSLESIIPFENSYIDNRILRVNLSEKELAERRSEWQQPDAKVKSGWLALYMANCRSASQGAAMQPW